MCVLCVCCVCCVCVVCVHVCVCDCVQVCENAARIIAVPPMALIPTRLIISIKPFDCSTLGYPSVETSKLLLYCIWFDMVSADADCVCRTERIGTVW